MIRAMVERGRRQPGNTPLRPAQPAAAPPPGGGGGKASQREQRQNDLAELISIAADGQVPVQVFKSLHKVFDVKNAL